MHFTDTEFQPNAKQLKDKVGALRSKYKLVRDQVEKTGNDDQNDIDYPNDQVFDNLLGLGRNGYCLSR
jgi:hypothetical protein